jgi:hypothetical protein
MSTQANPPNTEQFAFPEVIVGGAARLKCPHCGTKGLDNFIYIEDVQNYRQLISLKGKLLLINSLYKVFDEDGKNERLLCQTCGGECAIPESLTLDWE